MEKTNLLKKLKEKGFSKDILNAFEKVSRENFVPSRLRSRAYEDVPLPIGFGQTISQPYTIAIMLSLLDVKKGQKVLEVGSGSGYVLALLSHLVGKSGKIFGVEVISQLAERSKALLQNYKNVEVYNRNGSKGLPEHAPFDRILVSAACREVPQALLEQLKEHGILVLPLGPSFEQSLVAIEKTKGRFTVRNKLPGFVFVPFVN